MKYILLVGKFQNREKCIEENTNDSNIRADIITLAIQAHVPLVFSLYIYIFG